MPILGAVTTPDFLTADQAAEIAGVNRRTVNRWAETDRLPVAHRNPGATGALLFHRADVEALRDERRAELRAELAALESAGVPAPSVPDGAEK